MGVTKKEDGVRRLQCDYHLQNIGNLFKNLYLSDTLTDVTVACKDGAMNAHKIVLSAYSNYFNELIANTRTSNTHLTFVMHKISIENMKYLLEFMYKGFIDIPEECVAELMLIASELEVKGFLLSNEVSLAPNSESGRYDEELPKSLNNSVSIPVRTSNYIHLMLRGDNLKTIIFIYRLQVYLMKMMVDEILATKDKNVFLFVKKLSKMLI